MDNFTITLTMKCYLIEEQENVYFFTITLTMECYLIEEQGYVYF